MVKKHQLPLPSKQDLEWLERSPSSFESDNVHKIYDEIANHFSSTRYKPWPIISRFLESIGTNEIGLDAGCGNGKYIPLANHLFGLDRSINLLKHAHTAGDVVREVVLADALQSVTRKHVFDYAISIATIHHLATDKRRAESVQSLINAVSVNGGRILIYVWALEQGEDSRRAVPENSTTSSTSMGLDVWVPWVNKADGKVYNRYYHLFEKGELRSITEEAGRLSNVNLDIVQEGYEKDNWYIEVRTNGSVI
ncbi:hypothetical protein E3P99_01129 [Wallemia hederae]|uniref:Methyltransferase type 11 domain-containing protein n=1 Tax=Wallemia hederae TaxID=1540922 RepID=A0A4T0FRB9_9BASI|nr:hypothetical protein E3P99_01129 [Wallemia hederae]